MAIAETTCCDALPLPVGASPPGCGPRVRRNAAILVAALALGSTPAGWLAYGSPPLTRPQLEAEFQRQGKVLRPVPCAIEPGRAGCTVLFDRRTLATHAVYLAEPNGEPRFVYVAADGRLWTPTGGQEPPITQGELLVTPAGGTLFLDNVPLPLEVSGWPLYWVADADAEVPRELRVRPIAAVTVADDFMRQDIAEYADCRVRTGLVELARHGGGMAASADEAADAGFQRAANPFSVFARQHATVSYDVPVPALWADVHIEARFYFGVPKTDHVVDTRGLPIDTDMLVAQGADDGQQVAFGWCGAARAFRLLARHASGCDWTVLGTWTGRRPPLTNWMKLGLDLTRGHLVTGLLDDLPVLQARAPRRVRGPLHVLTGRGLTEFDDVRAWTLPAEPEPGCPLYVKSRSFAGKRTRPDSDPPQFREWASSTNVFVRSRWYDEAGNTSVVAAVTALPLMGDFRYDAISSADASGDLPPGVYEFGLYASVAGAAPNVREDRPVFAFRAERRPAGWTLSLPALPAAAPAADGVCDELPDLRLARGRDTGDRLAAWVGDRWVPLSPALPGPLHLAILRYQSGRAFLFSPSPHHHVIRCRNLINEFFEAAPSDWSWVDGAFRMDSRWACQDQWNFMACGSTALPYMTSKRRFAGDQVHEYFICLRSAFPWDAGDSTFRYDADTDRQQGFAVAHGNQVWYNRRDLNFSFCTDGRDPLSGYAVVFGGDDNRETRLLRRGEVVARTRDPDFLFPSDPSHLAVHWKWWKFTVRKSGGGVRVQLNDRLVFDFADPEPIDAGHIGFWSVRNGFALSRLTSVAERLDWQPQVLSVEDSVAAAWEPLRPDSVTLANDPQPGLVRATNTVGGGFFAVRWTAPAAVDLRAAPVLELPLRLGDGVVINLHLVIGGHACLLRLGDTPLTATKSLLVPEFERGECFRLPDLPAAQLECGVGLGTAVPTDGLLRVDLLARLQAAGGATTVPMLTLITLGNTSNAGYLLAGHGGNQAGTWYAVGVPQFRDRSPRTE